MDDPKLTLEQEQNAEKLLERLTPLFREEARRVSRLFASKPTEQILGKTEFQLRDELLQLGAASLETALDERKKGGTRGRA